MAAKGKAGKKGNKGKNAANTMREVTPQMYEDSLARNQLVNNAELVRRAQEKLEKKPVQTKLQVKKEQARIRLYGKHKSKREYTEKELGIPTLNRSVIPGFKVKHGKKGKKFIEDGDTVTLNRLIKTIGDKYDNLVETKLEKDRRLQEIRELKRQEMERKEAAKREVLDDKKLELKRKASMARTLRRKNRREALRLEREQQEQQHDAQGSVKSKKKVKKVSFA